MNIRKPVLIGHSLGGSVALQLNALLGHHVSGLVMVDFGPESDASGSQRVRADIRETPATFDTVDGYVSWLLERRPLANGRALRNLALHALRRTPAGVFEPKLDRRVADESPQKREPQAEQLWQMLASVRCPTLVVRGVGSAVLKPQVAQRMAHHALCEGQLATISRAGHAVMTDNPDEFNRTIDAFLASLPDAVSGGQ